MYIYIQASVFYTHKYSVIYIHSHTHTKLFVFTHILKKRKHTHISHTSARIVHYKELRNVRHDTKLKHVCNPLTEKTKKRKGRKNKILVNNMSHLNSILPSTRPLLLFADMMITCHIPLLKNLLLSSVRLSV